MNQKLVVARYLPAVLVLALSCAPVHAQSWSNAKSAQLDSLIRKAMTTADVPGASVAVVHNGHIVFERAYGVRDRNTGQPVNTATQFAIASVSKPVMTMLMASVVDSGRVSWTTRAQSIYPAFRVADAGASARITLQDLVCQCTGVPRYDAPWVYRGANQRPDETIGQVAGLPSDPVFGTNFAYNNQMAAIGGWLAAARAAGNTIDLAGNYRRELKTRIFDRIGMHSSSVDPNEVRARGNFAASHGFDMNWSTVSSGARSEPSFVGVAPAASVWSTAGDMGRWVITQLQRGVSPSGVRVVSERNLTETWRARVSIEPGFDYALGLFRRQFAGRPLIFHDGNGTGTTAAMGFFPEHGFGLVVLANRGYTEFNNTVRAAVIDLGFDLGTGAGPLLADLAQSAGDQRDAVRSLAAVMQPVPLAESIALAGFWSNSALGRVFMIQPATPHVRYSAESFNQRLLKYVNPSNGSVGYVFNDPEYLASFLLPLDAGSHLAVLLRIT
jgi:CubicO group peptidase (beta-lactamase class C family)